VNLKLKKNIYPNFAFTLGFGVIGFTLAADELALGFLGVIGGALIDIYILLIKKLKWID
jgi:hypothetical protein